VSVKRRAALSEFDDYSSAAIQGHLHKEAEKKARYVRTSVRPSDRFWRCFSIQELVCGGRFFSAKRAGPPIPLAEGLVRQRGGRFRRRAEDGLCVHGQTIGTVWEGAGARGASQTRRKKIRAGSTGVCTLAPRAARLRAIHDFRRGARIQRSGRDVPRAGAGSGRIFREPVLVGKRSAGRVGCSVRRGAAGQAA